MATSTRINKFKATALMPYLISLQCLLGLELVSSKPTDALPPNESDPAFLV
jgi:hypothetical protein